jgi:hypothetical protein
LILVFRLIAVLAAIVSLALALVNWIHFEEAGFYVSGRDSDVVVDFGDGYVIAVLAGLVPLARLVRTFRPAWAELFPWGCIFSGLAITAVSAAVVFHDWAGERMWTLYTELGAGIAMAIAGSLLLSLQRRRSSPPPLPGTVVMGDDLDR